MKRLALPLAVLGACWAALVAYVLSTVPQLPARIATHFDLRGVPNGWMDRSTHAWGIIGMGIGLPVFFLFILAIIQALDGGGCNIPNREYWLAPERRADTMAFIGRRMIWLSCLLVAFDAGLHALIVMANAAHPVRLPNREMGWLSGLLLAGVALWLGSLIIHFLRTPDGTRPRPTS